MSCKNLSPKPTTVSSHRGRSCKKLIEPADRVALGECAGVTHLVRLGRVMVDLYCASYTTPPEAVVLDIDDTVDVLHGHQRLSLLNAHYDERCFLPIHVYDAATGRPHQLRGRDRHRRAACRPIHRQQCREPIELLLRETLAQAPVTHAIKAHIGIGAHVVSAIGILARADMRASALVEGTAQHSAKREAEHPGCQAVTKILIVPMIAIEVLVLVVTPPGVVCLPIVALVVSMFAAVVADVMVLLLETLRRGSWRDTGQRTQTQERGSGNA